MKKLLFIRHGATAGNLERRYIGCTDEPLCDLGIGQITKQLGKFSAQQVFVSPMLRTRQTAQLLFPQVRMQVIEDFRETNFGIFEGKTYGELSDCPEYRQWVETGCTGPIPEGERVAQFKQRCCQAFETVISQVAQDSTAALVVHGGVIMAILEAYGQPPRDFYSYHIGNGEAITCDLEEKSILNIVKLPVD